MKTNSNITPNTINNASQFKVNRLVARREIKAVRHVVMLWDDENEGTGMAMATTETQEKWIKKLGKKAKFIGIEIGKNILLEDEFLRESAMIAMFN